MYRTYTLTKAIIFPHLANERACMNSSTFPIFPVL